MQYKVVYLNALSMNIMPRVECVQADSARGIKCYTDLNMSTITSARIYVKKPDGTEVYDDCTIENGYILAPLKSQILAVVGDVIAQLHCQDEDGFITTYKFIIKVYKSYISNSAIESSNEYTALENILTKAGASIVDSIAEMVDTTKIYYLSTDYHFYVYTNGAWTPIDFQTAEVMQNVLPYVTNANTFLTPGAGRTNISTTNLPVGNYEQDKWGTLLYMSENDEESTGYQIWCCIGYSASPYRGNLYARCIVTGVPTEWRKIASSVDIDALQEDIDLIGNDVEVLNSKIDNKANIDGFYEQMTVGLAENLLDTKATGTLQEIGDRRTSCGDVSITDDGVGQIESIRGNSVVFNQLIPKANVVSHSADGITWTSDGNGSVVANGTATANSTLFFHPSHSSSAIYPVISGHKYYFKGCPANGGVDKYYCSWSFVGNDIGNGIISTASSTTNIYLYARVVSGQTVSNLKFTPAFTDLTKIFGAGNEPSTVDDPKIKWLEKILEEHPEFNEGQLIDFYGMKSAGVMYDELTPTLATQRVDKEELSNLSFSKKAFEGNDYYYTRASSQYTSNIDAQVTGTCSAYIVTNENHRLPDNNCITFSSTYLGSGYSIVIRDDSISTVEQLIAKLTGKGTINYALKTPIETPINPPLNLNYKVADFGTEDIVDGKMVTDGFNQWDEEWENGLIDISTGEKGADPNRIRSKNYIPIIPNTSYYVYSGTIFDGRVCYYDDNFNFVSGVNTFPSGTIFTTPANAKYMLFCTNTIYGTEYKNDICINFSWSGYRNGQYEAYWKRETDLHIDDYFTPTSLLNSAFIGSIKYNDDYAREIANLKKNYISKKSFQNFLATLGTQLGGTFSMTWNDTDQDYDFNFTGGATE